MNSSLHTQLMKWTVPAMAFVIALFWYRRRRIDKSELERNDPGGELNKDNVILNDYKTIDTSPQDLEIQQITTQFLTNYNRNKKNLTHIIKMNDKTENVDFDGLAFCKTKQNKMEVAEKICDNVETLQDCIADCKDQSLTEEERIQSNAQACVTENNLTNINLIPQEQNLKDANISDESDDSGKGLSITEKKMDNTIEIYNFIIPQYLVGRLIGRYGSFLNSIRAKTNVTIYVYDHPYDRDNKICTIQGEEKTIFAALNLIRQKFPENKFPQITLAPMPLSFPLINVSCLSLIACVNNAVIVSHIVKPNWLFVQLPLHPTYHSLRTLESDMLSYYNQIEQYTGTLRKNDFVAAYWESRWVRASVYDIDGDGFYIIRLADHGGYWKYEGEYLKPLLSTHMVLPFQGVEIFLANIRAKNNEWPQCAYDLVANMCNMYGVGQAQVEGYIINNVYANIYFSLHNCGVFSLATELISKDFAEPVTWEQMRVEDPVISDREL